MLFPEQPAFSEGLRRVLTRAATDPTFRALCLRVPSPSVSGPGPDRS
jgi:hypothetical protein